MAILLVPFFISCSASKQVSKKQSNNKDNYSVDRLSDHHEADDAALRHDIVVLSKSYLNSPYQYGGDDPRGFDCSGFTTYIFGKKNILLPRTSSEQWHLGLKIQPSELKAGDLAFFGSDGQVTHVALISKVQAAKVYVVHSTTTKGVIESEITENPYWSGKLIGFKRVIP